MQDAARRVDFDPASEEAKELGREVERVGDAFLEAGREVQTGFGAPAEAALEDVLADIRRLKGEAAELNDRIRSNSKATQAWTRSMAGLRNAIAGLGLGLFLKQSLEAQLRLEQIEKRFTRIQGSAQGAEDRLASLRQETNQLGLNFLDAAQQLAVLEDNLSGKIPDEKIRNLSSGILEASRALDLTQDQTQRVIKAFSDMASKGTVSAEELRGQLGEAGLTGAMTLFADAVGVSEGELNKMLQRGEVLAADVLPKVGDGLRNSFGADAQANVETTSANLARFSNTLDTIRTNVAAGFLDQLNASLKEAAENSEGIAEGARVAGAGLSFLLNSAFRLVQALTGGVSVAAAQVTIAFGRLQQMIATVAATIADILPGFDEAERRIRAYRESVDEAIGTAKEFSDNSKEDFRSGVDGLKDAWNGLTEAVQGGGDAQEEAADKVQTVVPALEDEAAAASSAAEGLDKVTESSRSAAASQAELGGQVSKTVSLLDEVVEAYNKAQNATGQQEKQDKQRARTEGEAVERAKELQEEVELLQGKTTLTAEETNRLTEAQGELAAAMSDVRSAGEDVGAVFTDASDGAAQAGEQVAFFGAGSAEAAGLVDELVGAVEVADSATETFAETSFDTAGALDAQTIAGGKLEANLSGLQKSTQDAVLKGLLLGDASRKTAKSQEELAEATEEGSDAVSKQADEAKKLAERLAAVEESLKQLQAASGEGFLKNLEAANAELDEMLPKCQEAVECFGRMRENL